VAELQELVDRPDRVSHKCNLLVNVDDTKVTPLTVISVVSLLLLQSGIRLATTLSLALHLLYLSVPLRQSYSVRHLGLVSSHDRQHLWSL